jgi:hypothetical protein
MRLRDAHDRFNTIQSILYAVAVAGLLIASSIWVFYALNLPSEIQFTESSMSCRFYFNEPTLSEVVVEDQLFTQITLENCFSNAAVGDPALPVFPAHILLPADGEVDGIHVSYSTYELLPYDFNKKPVLPQQEFIPLSVDDKEVPFVINESAYESVSPLFTHLFELGEIGLCRGFSILTVYLHPVQYIPGQGAVYYFPEMTVTVDFKESTEAVFDENVSLLRYSDADRQLIKSIVANPTLIETYDPVSSGNGYITLNSNGLCDPTDNNGLGYQYVIITNNDLKDATGYAYNWSDLITHRKNFSNLEGTIVTVQDIDACNGYWNDTGLFNDTPAHIREFCKDAYLNWGTEYVLLGGDWDSNPAHQIVPYRLFTDPYETYPYDTMACDLYYSHLDGDWWDSAHGVWGGSRLSGVNDYYGELSVGRLAVSNASQISNAVQKIIWYDQNASGQWLRNASFWGGDLGWSVTSKEYMEELRLGNDTYRTFTGFEEWNTAHQNETTDTSEQLYDADLGGSYTSFFIESVEQDHASMINHIDHSDWTIPFSLNSWSSLSNTKPFLGYSQGCLAGRYQSGNAGCEQLICQKPRSFAYALVLNTGYGYGSSINTNGPGQYLESYFWDYFFTNQSQNMTEWHLGKAFLYSQDMLGAIVDVFSSHAWCYNWYSSHFFGDPAQLLRIVPENQPVQISDTTPADESVNVSVDISFLNVTLADPEGDLFSWNISTSPDVGSNSSSNATNGTKQCLLSDLAYETTYTWSVHTTDGSHWTNDTFTFTTVIDPRNQSPRCSSPAPINGTMGVPTNLSEISINLTDREGDLLNWTIQTSPDVDSSNGTSEGNGTKTCALSALQLNTTYTWYVNATDNGSGNTTSKWYIFTTESNDPPVFSAISPSNGSTGVSVDTTSLSLTIEDHENDSFNWSITTSPAIGNTSGTNASNGTKARTVSGLTYSTTYTWYVSSKDTGSNGWTNATYWFTTADAPSSGGWSPPPEPPQPVNHPPHQPAPPMGPTAVQLGVNYNYSSSSYDRNGDRVRLRFDWDDGSLSNWSAYVVSNASISFTHTWDSLSSYQVKVIAQDENGTLSNWSDPLIVTVSEAPANLEPPIPIINISQNATANQTIVFGASGNFDPDTIIVSYLWDFGDGTTGTGEKPTHSYTEPGVYQVTVVLVDAHGNRYTKTSFVTVAAAVDATQKEQQNVFVPLFLALGCLLIIGVCLVIVLRKHQKSSEPKVHYPTGTLAIEKPVDEQVDLLTASHQISPPVIKKDSCMETSVVSIEQQVDVLLALKQKKFEK